MCVRGVFNGCVRSHDVMCVSKGSVMKLDVHFGDAVSCIRVLNNYLVPHLLNVPEKCTHILHYSLLCVSDESTLFLTETNVG